MTMMDDKDEEQSERKDHEVDYDDQEDQNGTSARRKAESTRGKRTGSGGGGGSSGGGGGGGTPRVGLSGAPLSVTQFDARLGALRVGHRDVCAHRLNEAGCVGLEQAPRVKCK